MRPIIILVALSFVTALSVSPVRTQDKQPPTPWDELYATKVKAGGYAHNEFLARIANGRRPGRALDIGIGEGRNAFLLASQGWDVTGFDNSVVGIKLTQEEAQKRGLRVKTVIADVDQFDYGQEQWDLVAGMYMHSDITRNAGKIAASLRPGGILIVEGFQFDSNKRGVEGASYGYRANELLKAFDQLRVVYYEEAQASPYWQKSAPPVPIVRFAGIREPTGR